jgi:2-amino-4-hydroxy-6-hydroxymethyldihydropteridine diphosphokinase
MTLLILSLGSNVDAQANIRLAMQSLRKEFGEIKQSIVYESEAVGFEGENFLNLTVSIESDLSLEAINSFLKGLEDSLGRDRNQPRFSDRPIDIDILIFGEENGKDYGLDLPRAEILHNAFVLRPLAEVHPLLLHASSEVSYGEHWRQFDKAKQKLWPTDLSF